MARYLFPKAPFEKADIQRFVAALEAELQEAVAAGEDVERSRREQEESIDEYAATLNEEDATEFLLMCAAERLFLQKDPLTQQVGRGKDPSTTHVPGWRNLDLRFLNPFRALRELDLEKISPAVAGISIGVVLLIAVLVRFYVLFFS